MKVQIKKIWGNERNKTCVISQQEFDSLGLLKGEKYHVHFGGTCEDSLVEPSKNISESMHVPEGMMKKMMLCENMKLNIWKKNKDIHLGPIVGIFENEWVVERIMNGGACFYDEQHMKASMAEGCFCYYFSPKDIDWDEERIKGTTFVPGSGRWKCFWVPMPDVIYDEGIFLTKELKPLAKQIRNEFRSNSNVQFINSRNGLGKWELCEKLSKHPAVKKYVPETMAYAKFDDVLEMLEKHKVVFVKSFYGSKGEEVLAIEQDDRGAYKLDFFDYHESELKQVVLNDMKEVEAFINKFFGEERLIVQQGIRLAKYKGRHMDIRILLMKNEKGTWKPIYNTCRVSNKSRITNLSAGAGMIIYEQAYSELKKSFPQVKIPSIDEIYDATIKIARHIERDFGMFGELGMDMAVDIHGDIWVIEANAKPNKGMAMDIVDMFGTPFYKLLLKGQRGLDKRYGNSVKNSEMILPQALATFKYAKFLAARR